MEGIEAIIDGIKQRNDCDCEKILKEAEEKILKMKKKSRDLTDEKIRFVEEEYKEETKLILEKGKTFIENFKKKEFLKAKDELIKDLIKKAKMYIIDQELDIYFSFILKLIHRFKSDKKGEVVFSDEDLKRMPKNFKTKVSEISDNKLTISKTSRNINYGFILIYGRMEEDCSIDAIFKANYEKLQDTINKNLFKI